MSKLEDRDDLMLPRLLHWVALAQREYRPFEHGFEITRRGNGRGYTVSLGRTTTVESEGEFEFSSESMDAVERFLIARLGAEARIREFPTVNVPSTPGDLPPGFAVNQDRDSDSCWVLVRGGAEVARVRRGDDDYSPAVEFSHIADADPWMLRDSFLDPAGLPLFSVDSPPPEPLVITRASTHFRKRQCPGAWHGEVETELLSHLPDASLVRCVRCGALYQVIDDDWFTLSRRQARRLFRRGTPRFRR